MFDTKIFYLPCEKNKGARPPRGLQARARPGEGRADVLCRGWLCYKTQQLYFMYHANYRAVSQLICVRTQGSDLAGQRKKRAGRKKIRGCVWGEEGEPRWNNRQHCEVDYEVGAEMSAQSLLSQWRWRNNGYTCLWRPEYNRGDLQRSQWLSQYKSHPSATSPPVPPLHRSGTQSMMDDRENSALDGTEYYPRLRVWPVDDLDVIIGCV
ncbi:hypothetical protein B0T17DRAFT_509448 [Bombardia bombarda]|uniref:Uncharacterized protein n=1 Tax=Bombardia bombarda TaxID=252184 RepID=A0AA40BXX8_9PEZI|nr:hypothetical protein B0T17DRAFT_509448 [Bombardia bombarda]